MKRVLLFVIAAMSISATAYAGNELIVARRADSTINYRPRVGVVLSGGGAKGIAHIGVLRILEELKIPVDYVTGTSIGSIIGGLYALGYTPDEMENLIINTDWNEMMKDQISRRDRLYEFSERDDRLLIDVPVMNRKSMVQDAERDRDNRKAGNPSALSNIPLALVEGQNLNSLFAQLSVGYQDDIDFNDLPVPFACVAVDLVSRKPVVIRSGNIVDAMRSSMAIPGYFTPIMKDGKMLVDGGMLNNLPVDVIREMGADIVIAVDLHKYDKINFKKPDNVGDMVTSILKILNGDKYQASIKEADICISPNTGKFGILDFTPQSLKALSDSGYFAALEEVHTLEQLALLEKDYWKNPVPKKKHAIDLHQDSVRVSQISISGADPKETEYLMDRCREYVGEYVTGADMDGLVKKLYNTRAFSKVAYSIANTQEDSSYILKMNFSPEKLHSVGLGLRFDSEEIVAALLNVSFYRHKLYGWKAELDAILSYNPVVSIMGGYGFSEMWQLNTSLQFRRSDISSYSEGQKLEAMTYYGYKGDIYMQRKGIQSDLRFIYQYENIRVQHPFDNIYSHHLSFGIDYNFDNRDKGYFATKGLVFRLSSKYNFLVRSNLANGDHPFGVLNMDLLGTIRLGDHVALLPGIMTRMKIGVDEDSYKYSLPNIVGGYEFARYTDSQMPFIGANYSYYMDDLAAIARLDVRVNFAGKNYLYLRSNVLGEAPSFGKISTENAIYKGFGVGYERETIIGPVGVNIHWSDLSKRMGFYLTAGFSF